MNTESILEGYIPNQALLDALNQNNLALLRAFLTTEINDQYAKSEDILKMGLYAETKNTSLFDEYHVSAYAEAFEEEQTKWTSDYFSMQLVYLSNNFSKVRFLHLVLVHEVLFEKEENVVIPLEETKENDTSMQVQEEKTFSQTFLSKKGVIIGGAIAVVVAALIAKLRNH